MDSERRSAHTTAPDYLQHLDRADTSRVRQLRDDCRAEERRLSYVRRVVQGHLDLALAELARRRDDGSGTLVTDVTRTLTGPGSRAVSLRAVALYAPTDGDARDAMDEVATASLPDLDEPALVAHVEELRRRERTLSDRRAILLGHLDRLQAALVERYRDGRAAVDDLAITLDGD